MTVEALVPSADKKAFAQCFNRLAKAKRAKDIDAADLQIYFDTLKALPLWAVEEAANELQRTPTFGFPDAATWYQAADAEVKRRQRESLHQQRQWRDECHTCQDTGWKEHQCTNDTRCGRHFCTQMGEKHAHSYYSACPCREHNSTYRRNTLASQLGHGNKEAKT